MFNAKFTSLLSPGEKVTGEQLETDRQIVAFDRELEGLSRRRFMSGLTGAAALAASAGFIEMPKAFAQASTTPPPITDVLNFALNLEYLEANFYNFAATGSPIASSFSGTPTGALTGTNAALTTAVKANPTVLALAKALAQDELNHIETLRGAITSLGGTPIAQPALNYAAKGAVTTVAQFLAAARQFTALGNSAYAGAAQYLVSNPGVLTVAAQILGAEGQHLGAVNYQCITQNVTASFSTTSTAYIDEQDQPPNPTQYFTVFLTGNASGGVVGFAPARSTAQDLGVVYGVSTPSTVTPPTGTTSGGFFPSGVNGNIKST